MNRKTKIGYGYDFDNTIYPHNNLCILIDFLNDISYSEEMFINWAFLEDKFYGGNVSHLEKVSKNKIKMSIDFYDSEEDYLVLSLQNYLELIEQWQAFGKSGKPYMILQEKNNWYSLENPSEENND